MPNLHSHWWKKSPSLIILVASKSWDIDASFKIFRFTFRCAGWAFSYSYRDIATSTSFCAFLFLAHLDASRFCWNRDQCEGFSFDPDKTPLLSNDSVILSWRLIENSISQSWLQSLFWVRIAGTRRYIAISALSIKYLLRRRFAYSDFTKGRSLTNVKSISIRRGIIKEIRKRGGKYGVQKIDAERLRDLFWQIADICQTLFRHRSRGHRTSGNRDVIGIPSENRDGRSVVEELKWCF